MKRALVTGSLGFVGRYLREEMEEHGYDVIGLDVRKAEQTICGNLLDAEQTLETVRAVRPDIVIHLAGQPDVGLSWKEPQRTIQVNVLAALNLMEALRQTVPGTRLVLVGSSDEYGQLGQAGQDVREELALNPQTPYAVSKQAQEELAGIYVRVYGMNICMTRSFNHGGRGQREGFVIPDFASGVVRVEKGLQSCLRVGNLEARRDFTHVRDVVRAYRLIAQRGRTGEIYNVGSGQTHSAAEILKKMRSLAMCEIPVETDSARMRPSDTPVLRCNHEKLTRDTGWEPRYGIDEIVHEVLEEWREKLS